MIYTLPKGITTTRILIHDANIQTLDTNGGSKGNNAYLTQIYTEMGTGIVILEYIREKKQSMVTKKGI